MIRKTHHVPEKCVVYLAWPLRTPGYGSIWKRVGIECALCAAKRVLCLFSGMALSGRCCVKSGHVLGEWVDLVKGHAHLEFVRR